VKEDNLDHLEKQVREENPDKEDNPDLQVYVVCQEDLVKVDLLDHKVNLEREDLLDQLDNLVTVDREENLVKEVLLDLQDSRVSLVR